LIAFEAKLRQNATVALHQTAIRSNSGAERIGENQTSVEMFFLILNTDQEIIIHFEECSAAIWVSILSSQKGVRLAWVQRKKLSGR
jgi:hypothetical protein